MTLAAPSASTPEAGSSVGATFGGPQAANADPIGTAKGAGAIVEAPAGCAEAPEGLLVDGFNHVAVLTADTERAATFYRKMFGATVEGTVGEGERICLTLLKVGATAKLNLFEIVGNDQAERQAPMFGRGRLDHLALQATSMDSFDMMRDRLVASGASNGFVTDFGDILSLWFRDPDGLEGEICIPNPDAQPGVYHPPGRPSRRHHPASTPSPQ